MKVLLDLNKPLRLGAQIGSIDCPEHWTDFKYERLPSFCTNCGRLGHEARVCEAEVKHTKIFGPWLKAETKVMSPMFAAWEEKIDAWRKNRNPPSTLSTKENSEVVWRLPEIPPTTGNAVCRPNMGKENATYSTLVNSPLGQLTMMQPEKLPFHPESKSSGMHKRTVEMEPPGGNAKKVREGGQSVEAPTLDLEEGQLSFVTGSAAKEGQRKIIKVKHKLHADMSPKQAMTELGHLSIPTDAEAEEAGQTMPPTRP